MYSKIGVGSKPEINYTEYAREILDRLLEPAIEDMRNQNWSNRPIDIVVSDSKEITTEDLEDGEVAILDIYHDRDIDNYTNRTQAVDYFVFQIEDNDLLDSDFALARYSDNNRYEFHYFTYPYNDNCSLGKSWSISRYTPLNSLTKVSEMINILKKLMFDKYRHYPQVNVYTEKEYQILKVSRLYTKIKDISNEFNLSDGDLAKAKQIGYNQV